MSETVIRSYIGVAKVHARAFGTSEALRFVGNVSVVTLKHKLDVQKQRDFTRPGGGTAVRVERIEEVSCDMTWLNFNAENMALATAGTASHVAAGSVTDEPVKVKKGALVPLVHPPLAITAVNLATGGGALLVGVDYEASAGGIKFLDTSSAAENADVLVDYTYAAYDRIEGATKASTKLQLFVEGINEADSDKPCLVDLWQVSMPSADEIALIGEKLGELKFSAELLKDPSKGSGVSAFYRSRQVS